MAITPMRVLVVDDSAVNRKHLVDIFSATREIEVVGRAGDGEEALRAVMLLKPDAITLDLEMPKMDGFTFLRILMAKQPTPVIVVSSYSQKENVFKALELGAVDFVAKPSRLLSLDAPIRRELLAKIAMVRNLRPIVASVSQPPGILRSSSGDTGRYRAFDAAAARPLASGALRHLVAIGSSTGGPTALLDLIMRIPERFPGAILIAQHMPEKFTRTFAERLDKKGTLQVTEAQDGDVIVSRRAYVCPGKTCMEVVASPGTPVGAPGEFRLRVTAPADEDRFVPSADRLLRSAAAAAGSRAIGIILTGMGDDGTEGARAIRAAGGTVIAESETTAVVYGMPRAAVSAGVVSESLALPAIGDFLAALT